MVHLFFYFVYRKYKYVILIVAVLSAGVGVVLDQSVNVEKQQLDDDSVLNFYKLLIKYRKSEELSELILYGDFQAYLEESTEILMYKRKLENKSIFVIANFSDQIVRIHPKYLRGDLVISNYAISEGKELLEPYQVIVMEQNT